MSISTSRQLTTGSTTSATLSRAWATLVTASLARGRYTFRTGRKGMPPDQNDRATILVVEDDESVAHMLTDVLELAGYRVWQGGTGARARALADRSRPDLIVLDLMLPDVDGLVLCPVLKAQAHVPVVVCSGTSRRRDAVLALKLGADDFIAKPCNKDDLLARIEAILRRSAPTRSRAPTPHREELRAGTLV